MAERHVAVVCESTACLPAELVQRYGIKVVPVPFVIGCTTFRDGVDISPDMFYERLRATSELPKTSPPEPGAYLEAWQSAGPDCTEILVVTVAGRIGTFERSARMAQQLMAESSPGVRVKILDSGSAAMGQGFVALEAARAACRGMDLDTVCAEAEAVARRVNLVVTLDTLRYLARTSRIPQVASIVSSILDLKPIIRLVHGEVQPVGRVRSRKRSLEQLVVTICKLSPADKPMHLAIHHARAQAEADRLLALTSQQRSVVETYVTEFTPVMGAYCGPGLVGAAFYPANASEST
jgi:DegV family protein with EDD domain